MIGLLSTTTLLIAATLAAGAGDFEIHLLDGQSVVGEIVNLNGEQIELKTSQGERTLPLSSLGRVTRVAGPEEERKANLWVELVDQSGLAATAYTVAGGKAQVTLPSGTKVELSTRAIRWVRFTSPADRDVKLAAQWQEIVDTKAAGDLLVVRKSGSLDYLEGVLGDLDAEICKFELDKEVRPVKRPKIEGIVYLHSTAPELSEPVAQAAALDGSRFAIRKAELRGANLTFTTVGDVTLEIPLADLARFDFSLGKIAYLSDLEPDSATYVPYFSFKEDFPSLREYFKFHRDIGFDRAPLRLNGQIYAKGLSLQSRTSLAYKLPGKFRQFKAVVGIDDSVRDLGNVRLEIKADGKSLWQGEVRGSDPPRELDLAVEGVKRLEIMVDYGEGLDIGDRLDLCEARVAK